MMRAAVGSFVGLVGLVSIGTMGCGGSPSQIAETPPAAAAPAAPQVLSKSLFNPQGTISEDDLQKVLSTGIDLAFPARVGVLPVAKPFDPNAEVSISLRTVAASQLANSLSKAPQFSQVSNVSTDLPTVGGIDGLRAIAARYRVRYLVLYSERFEDETHVNGWAALYPTIIGIFVTPSVTVESHGIAEADLIDVRTGTILASSIQPLEVDSATFVVGAGRQHRDLQRETAGKAAPDLARDLAGQLNALVAFAEEARATRPASRYLPPPVDLEAPILGPRPTPKPAEGGTAVPNTIDVAQ